MRIAIFLRAPEVWGAETSLLTLLSTSAAQAQDITVFLPAKSPLVAVLSDRGIRWRNHEFSTFSSLAKGGLSDGSLFDLARDSVALIRGGWSARKKVAGFDLILTFGLWETPEIALAGRLAKVPVVWDFHVTFAGRLARPAMRGLRVLVSAIVAPSEATFGLVGVTRKPTREHVIRRPVVPGSTDVQKIRTSKRTVVGIFGQIDDRKSVLELLNALIDYQDNVKVSIVGAQPLKGASAYEQQVREFVALRSPTWELKPRTSRVAEEMMKCDYVVNLSKHEAFGRTVVEAILAGTHPIVLSGDGPEEIVNMTGIGTVISSLEELPQAVLNPIDAHTRDVTEHDRRRTAALFAPERVAEEYFEVLGRHALPSRARNKETTNRNNMGRS